MSPPNPNQTNPDWPKIGYNSTIGLIQGDYLCGGYKIDFTLDDPNLFTGAALDYLNALNGIHTTIENNTRYYLSQTFATTYPIGWGGCAAPLGNSTTWSYQGNDRRELLFGTNSPNFSIVVRDCVRQPNGYVFRMVDGSYPIVTEVPGKCVSFSASEPVGPLNLYSVYINFLWLNSQFSEAEALFNKTPPLWNPTPGTGINYTTGGYFTNQTSSNGCYDTRALAYWLEMARATQLWDSSNQSRAVAQQVANELWAHQNPDGSISVNYPSCGKSDRDSGESDGLVLMAFDAQVPYWFPGNGIEA